jgi:2-polyprenyl-3-methyl-5-hydroxy-6-metoxy-1,4-benzoquinol methylase
MALAHHSNHQMRFDQQVDNSINYVLPFVEKTLPIKKGMHILEIGCGEGGVLKAFQLKGANCLGVDLNKMRIDLANDFLAEEVNQGNMEFLYKNVYDEDFQKKYTNYFDLIILKDVIEHLPNQEGFIPFMKKLLKPKGQIFFGFPPWYMPFGGHQQIASQKWTSKMPYYHILPMGLYKSILQWASEPPEMIEQLVEIKETGISIERFEKIVKASGYNIINKQWFLFNPIYKFKFGLNPRKQNWLFGAIPFVRNFLTTCAYYTIQKN